MSANKKGQFKSYARLLCAGGLTVVVAGLGYFYGAPKLYRATAKAKIMKSAWSATNQASSSFGPERLPEECRIIRSDDFLNRAITNLDLNIAWGKKFNQSAPLTTAQTRERLKAMLNVHPAPNAIMVEIQATGTDPVELANIVNEIAKEYADFRQSGRMKASHLGVDALRAKWEVQSRKVLEADAEYDKLLIQVKRERAANPVLDTGLMEQLRSQQAVLQSNYDAKSNEVAQLKAMNPVELRNAAVQLDTNTNSVLVAVLRQLTNANNDLRDARAAHGADAPETKGAQLVVDQLGHQADGQANATITLREVELKSIGVTLQQVNEMAARFSRSTNQSPSDLARLGEQDAAVAKAKENLETLRYERDALEAEMRQDDTENAVMPGAIVAQIVETADPPSKPVSPDPQVVRVMLIVGVVAMGAGALLLALLATKPREADKKAA